MSVNMSGHTNHENSVDAEHFVVLREGPVVAPRTFSEAVTGDHKTEWLLAIQAEFETHIKI
jgi:hypothetical protein